MNNYYKDKYFKYKSKYQLLKNEIEGGTSSFVPKLTAAPFVPKVIADKPKLNLNEYTENRFDFWTPLFNSKAEAEIELNILRAHIKRLIDSNTIKEQILFDLKTNFLSEIEQQKINNNIYAIILIIAYITKKFEETLQNYRILIKGGKMIQMLLATKYPGNTFDYKSNDIDILIINRHNYEHDSDENEKKYLSICIANLIRWILNTDDSNLIITPINIDNRISIQYYPMVGVINKNIIKIAYFRILGSNLMPLAISDIDFKKPEHPEFYSDIKESQIPGFGYLNHQSIDNVIDEKIFYFINILNNDPNSDFKNLTLRKFKKQLFLLCDNKIDFIKEKIKLLLEKYPILINRIILDKDDQEKSLEEIIPILTNRYYIIMATQF